MTQIERETLVERYLAGEMTHVEEGEFFIHVAVDEELQRTLKAYRVMEETIRVESLNSVPDHAQYRSGVMAMLAASHVIGGGVVVGGLSAASAGGGSGTSVVGTATTASAGATAGTVGTFAGFGLLKTLTVALVGVSLAVGTAVFVSSGSTQDVRGTAPGATIEKASLSAPSTIDLQEKTIVPSVAEPNAEANTTDAQIPTTIQQEPAREVSVSAGKPLQTVETAKGVQRNAVKTTTKPIEPRPVQLPRKDGTVGVQLEIGEKDQK